MNNNVILISAVCGDIGFSATKAIKRNVEQIIGCDVNTLSPAWNGNLVDIFYKVPPANQKREYIQEINRIINKHRVDYFLPISEPEIEVINRFRHEIDISPDRIMINNSKIIETFLDKYKTAKYLSDFGIKVPETIILSQYRNEFNFPVTVKSRSGYGNKRRWKIQNNIALEQIRAKDDGSLIVQEHIGTSDSEYTTGVFSNGLSTDSITFRRKLGYGGLSVEVIYEEIPFIEKLAKKVAEKFELKGCINIQTRRDNSIYIPFEINPRLSSTLLFRKKFGFNDAVWWIDMMRKKNYVYRKKYRRGSAIRYLSEKYYDMNE